MAKKKSTKKIKKEIQKEDKVKNNLIKSLIISIGSTIGLILIIIIVGILIDLPTRGPRFVGTQFLDAQIIVNSISLVILIVLLSNYISIYLKTKANFSLGLIGVTLALMMHAITANPLLLFIFGFREPSGLFALLSSIFTLVASIVLLYLSRE